MVSLVVKRGSLVRSDTGSSDCSPHNSVSSCLSVVISLAKLTQRHVVGIYNSLVSMVNVAQNITL